MLLPTLIDSTSANAQSQQRRNRQHPSLGSAFTLWAKKKKNKPLQWVPCVG
jgi:hypothetical protein